MKFLLFLLLTIALLGVAAAGAIHYNFVDLVKLESQWGLSKYPLIGKLFKPPVAEPQIDETETPAKMAEPPPPPVLPKPAIRPPSVPVDTADLQKQAAQRQEEEQRRLVKVSRLYDGMKPEEAAPILNELEDESVLLIFSKMDQERVSKILTLFDAKRSARLSNAMLKGKVTD